MPLVDITLIDGRAREAKLRLIEAVTDAVVSSIDAPRESVRVILREVPGANWAVGGIPKG